jgi:hypothetical protein
MALLTNAGESYTLSNASGVGLHNREDLADFITNISPTDCPFQQAIGKTKSKAVIHEWLTHELAAAAATNVVVEGNEASLIAPTTMTRVTNVTQINQKAVAVSGTQDAVDKAGMAKELAYRVILHTKEIKRDLETAMLQNTVAVAGDTTTARRLNGVYGFISTNTSTTTLTTLAESHINAMLEDCWDQGGMPDVLMCNGGVKRSISGLASNTSSGANYALNMDADQKKFTKAVDIWDGDFGVQRVVANRFDNTTTVKALQLDMWRHAELRSLSVETLGKSGDTEKRLLTAEGTLECRQEKANGMLILS